MIKRLLEEKIVKKFFCWKILMIVWARQVGKTTLIEKILETYFKDKRIVRFNWDYLEDRELLNVNSLSKLNLFVKDKNIIFIDEAQKIKNIW